MREARLLRVVRLGLLGFVIAGCSAAGGGPPAGQNPGGGRPATTITVAKATTGPISQVIGYTGSVQAADTVSVVPVISGRITKLNVDVGSTVKAGDVIAELDKSTLNAQIEQAQAGVDAANVKLSQIQAGARGSRRGRGGQRPGRPSQVGRDQGRRTSGDGGRRPGQRQRRHG